MKLGNPRSKNTGVTLMELLTVIALVGILMAIGIPSYRTITNSARIAGEVNGLLGDLQLARAEAVKQGLPVTVCVSSNGTGCANSVNWDNGWIVFVDVNNNQSVDSSEATRILKVQKIFSGGDTFVSSGATAATFNREGFASLSAGGTPVGASLVTLHASTANDASTRCLAVDQLGRANVVKTGTSGCT